MPAQAKSALRTRRQDKASQRYQDRKARRACLDAVWARAEGDGARFARCEQCGTVVHRSHHYAPLVGHVHEKLARSLGGDPTDPNGCVLLCPYCHTPSGAHRRSVRAER